VSLPQTEAQFQAAVIQYARLRGWLVAHFRPARTSKGWRTPMTGDPGFPDLVMTRRGTRQGEATPLDSPGRVIFIELKTERGKVSVNQAAWLDALGDCPGVEVWLWRPRDWPTIEEVLR
jgi:hypothetical protein